MNRRTVCMATGCMLLALVVSCAQQARYRLPVKHPPIFELGERREFCTKCHGYRKEPVDFERYNHTPLFTDSHRMVAYQNQNICAICHEQSFCNDCHASRTELKPSEKSPTETYRRMQHRGDYLSRHRIDARLDPSSCFRCHGNPRAAATCRPCHG